MCVEKKGQQYYLLNKDIIIAKFHIDMRLDSVVMEEQYVELPAWFGDLRAFIPRRRAPKSRENIKQLLQMGGCDTLKGFIDISHALSLVDTFWVKPVDSVFSWEDVSRILIPLMSPLRRQPSMELLPGGS